MSERVKFEEWLKEVHLLEATWNEDRNCYNEYPAHLAYKAWQASRAVPDVPELVTVGYADIGTINLLMHGHVGKASIAPKSGGEFKAPVILQSQATEIIAAKDKEIEGVRRMLSSIDAGYGVYGKLLERAEAAEAKLAQYEAQEAAPAADLKAKCDRYEQTLRGIAELSATGMSFGDLVFAVTISRAALNVEASHDKG